MSEDLVSAIEYVVMDVIVELDDDPNLENITAALNKRIRGPLDPQKLHRILGKMRASGLLVYRPGALEIIYLVTAEGHVAMDKMLSWAAERIDKQ